MDFIEPCFGIGHNLSLICQMTSEDIKHQLIIINASTTFDEIECECLFWLIRFDRHLVNAVCKFSMLNLIGISL